MQQEHRFFHAPGMDKERAATRLVDLAMAPERPGEPTAVTASRRVIADHEAEGRVFGGRDKGDLIAAVTRAAGIGRVGEAEVALKADVAIQRMGRQRLRDLENGIRTSEFAPRDIEASMGGILGLDRTHSRADSLAVARGSFENASTPVQQSIVERVNASRRDYHERAAAGLDRDRMDRADGVAAGEARRGVMAQAAALSGGERPDRSEAKGPSQASGELVEAMMMRAVASRSGR